MFAYTIRKLINLIPVYVAAIFVLYYIIMVLGVWRYIGL